MHTRQHFQNYNVQKLKGEKLKDFFLFIRKGNLTPNGLVFVCIGTDRSSGDALGPLVGTGLVESGYPHVIGTLQFPCDSSNLVRRLDEIPAGRTVIAIDACLGQPSSVGLYQVSSGPLMPGKSLGKPLPPVGDYSLAAIVNAVGPRQYTILQTTSLYKIMLMAGEISAAIKQVFPIVGGNI